VRYKQAWQTGRKHKHRYEYREAFGCSAINYFFVASILSERLLASVVGSRSISNMFVNISKNLTRMRVGNLLALVDSIGIVVLGVLFYIVFNR